MPPAVTVAPDIGSPDTLLVTVPAIALDIGSRAKSWAVALPAVTTTPVSVWLWYPVALAVTSYVPGAILML